MDSSSRLSTASSLNSFDSDNSIEMRVGRPRSIFGIPLRRSRSVKSNQITQENINDGIPKRSPSCPAPRSRETDTLARKTRARSKTGPSVRSRSTSAMRSLFSSGRNRKQSELGILDLPAEIIEQILSYSDIAKTDQFNFGRTCSKLHRFALVTRYKDFELKISFRRNPKFMLLTHIGGDSQDFNGFIENKDMIKSLTITFEDVTKTLYGHSRTLFRNEEFAYKELEFDTFYWLVNDCTEVRSLNLIAPKDTPFDFNVLLNAINGAIFNMPFLTSLRFQSRPYFFDFAAFMRSLEQPNEKISARLTTLGISFHGIHDEDVSSEKLVEAVSAVLIGSKDYIKVLFLTIGADWTPPGTPVETLCFGSLENQEKLIPIIKLNGEYLPPESEFPNVTEVELSFEGPTKQLERFLKVDYEKIRKLGVRCWMGGHTFEIKETLQIGSFRKVKELELYQYLDNRDEEYLAGYLQEIRSLLPSLNKAKVVETWNETCSYLGVETIVSKSATAVYVTRATIRRGPPMLHKVQYKEETIIRN
ncbi:hypothetical protein H072_290 [Dactylellina haptotyla CBS 200.50]|uniref:F-box domain-containing protein n=1 Tax=Dactylellina haptotyla (strain CBS 200.50) TaxID=1284197 RepID=S8AY16_DACHA|nr:hypothetical protein H072_290 [Dactylellina haptotyla CBS 200.50]